MPRQTAPVTAIGRRSQASDIRNARPDRSGGLICEPTYAQFLREGAARG